MNKKKKLLLLGAGASETVNPPLNFTPTVLMPGSNIGTGENAGGLLLANSDLSLTAERLNTKKLLNVRQRDSDIYAVDSTKLYVSNDYGETFQEITPTVTNLKSVEVVGNHIIVSGLNGLTIYDADLTFITTVAASVANSALRAKNGRLFLAESSNDGIFFSDDWGVNQTFVTGSSGSGSQQCNVRAFESDVFAWTGEPGFLTTPYGPAVAMTKYSNWLAGDRFVDFEFLSNGRLVLVGDTNGIYYTDDPFNASASFTQVQAPSDSLGHIYALTDRLHVSGDGGIYTSADNALSWSFTDITQIAGSDSAISCDDFVYLVNESGEKLYDENEDFLIKEIPQSQQIGNVVYWFDSSKQDPTDSDGRLMIAATDSKLQW